MPLISAIVPCYDVERWLSRCLDSVLSALPADAELIAVDDGSRDSTLRILQERAKGEPRMKVIAAKHAGVSAARNRALDAACGRYVFFVDPDDEVEPAFFGEMAEALERDHADCCICGYSEREEGSDEARAVRLKGDYRFRSNGEIVRAYLPRIFGYSFDDIRSWYRGVPLFTYREMAFCWRMAFRRETIEAGRIRFDEALELNEDALFNAECLLSASSMTCIDRPLYRSLHRDSGAVRTISRDGARYCRNKLVLLRKRDALNRASGGRLAPLYAGSCVLSALEILSYVVRGRVRRVEGLRIFREYLAAPSVRAAVVGFPLSVRRPVLAAAVLSLRALEML